MVLFGLLWFILITSGILFGLLWFILSSTGLVVLFGSLMYVLVASGTFGWLVAFLVGLFTCGTGWSIVVHTLWSRVVHLDY